MGTVGLAEGVWCREGAATSVVFRAGGRVGAPFASACVLVYMCVSVFCVVCVVFSMSYVFWYLICAFCLHRVLEVRTFMAFF